MFQMPEIPFNEIHAFLYSSAATILGCYFLYRLIRHETRRCICDFCGEKCYADEFGHHVTVCVLKQALQAYNPTLIHKKVAKQPLTKTTIEPMLPLSLSERNHMKPFSFADEAKKADSSSYFKPKDPSNHVRIVSEFVLHESSYEGRLTRQFVGYVIDRSSGAVKPAFLPKTVIDKIADLQVRGPESYGFDSVPMPYGINITRKSTGPNKFDVEYGVIPARQNTPLTEDELKVIADLNAQDFIAELKKGKEKSQTTAVQPSRATELTESFFKPEDVPPGQQAEKKSVLRTCHSNP